MKFTKFKSNFTNEILPNKPDFIREGQALMNYLGDIWFMEYHRISSINHYEVDVDCFHNDKLIQNTWRHLEKNWEKFPS
jgi:hypothetical protein